MTKLFFIKDIKKSGTSCSSFEGNKKYIATADIQNSEIVNYEIVDYENKPSRANLIAPEDSVLFAKMQGTNKVIRLNNETKNNIYSTGFYAFKDERILPDYLKHYLSSRFFNDIKDKNCQGATMKAINDDGLSKISINVPELEEQQEIVKKLNVLTSLIDKNKQIIENYSQLVKSQFIEMFGDPVSNTKGWSATQLSEHIKFLTSGSRGWAKYFSEHGEYFITIKNVKNCKITLDDVQYITPPQNAEAKRTKVQEGDLLISITADLGRTGIVTKEIAEYGGYINQHLSCIRVDNNELNSLYLAHYLESDAGKIQFQAKNQSVVKAGLNFASINSLRILTPPIELQNQFADFVKHIDKLKLNDMLMEVA